ncbi:MAG TPA: M36 family metallopeptidase, partial [Pyrinomonadaceae bacterium]
MAGRARLLHARRRRRGRRGLAEEHHRPADAERDLQRLRGRQPRAHLALERAARPERAGRAGAAHERHRHQRAPLEQPRLARRRGDHDDRQQRGRGPRPRRAQRHRRGQPPRLGHARIRLRLQPGPRPAGRARLDQPGGRELPRGRRDQLFFWTNRYHDRLYELGFTEAARNFQQNNFGRNPGGGTANAIAGNDFVRAEAQDFSGTNNANFSTGSDGNPGRMQMYIWPNTSPQRDGDFDNEIVIHELTHGTSNRLHANASGLGSTISRGMGEGWSDFYARALLSTADDDVDGVYAMGAYATHLATAGYTNNAYYGIRRFPYAVRSNIGPNGRPHNPLTFADTNPNTIDLTDGAFARGPFGAGGRGGALAVHNIGEVWCMALFEVRARLIKRLGYEVGNRRMLQLVTDAMKLDPVNPTLIDGRNSLLAADAAGFASEDVQDIWAGFATRGMGFGATMATENANGKESFDNPLPGLGTVTFSDASCNANGVADPGEDLTLSLPLTNPLHIAVNGVTATVGGETVDFGTIEPGQTVTRGIPYTVPAGAACGDAVTGTVVVASSLGEQTKTFTLSTGGAPVVTFAENFDGATAPALPAGWSALVNPVGSPVWRTVNTSGQSAPNAAFVNLAATTSLSFLQSPFIPVTSATAQLTFRHSYNTEFEWDGAILQISLDGGTTFLDILDSGAGARMIEGGFPFKIITAADGNTNLLQNRPAWTGNSGGFITTRVQLPAAAAGRNVRFRWISGADSAFTPTGAGWTIDNVALVEGYQCAAVATTTTVDAATVQYSDQTTLSATVSSTCFDPVGTVEFTVNGTSVGSAPVNGGGTVSVPYTSQLAAGAYTITAEFVGSNPRYLNSSGASTLTVTKEDASVTPSASNPVAVKVNSAGGTAG